jgi:hypothetical protein
LLLALITPLAVCGLLLAWYNWARFDSIFEFGLYYQLAAFNLQANYSILFSPVYLLQNIYNYFLNPFGLSGSFPFLLPLAGTEKPVFASLRLPTLYAVEGKFPGALTSTPFLLFAILPPVMFFLNFIKQSRNPEKGRSAFGFFDWTVLGLLGASIAGLLAVLARHPGRRRPLPDPRRLRAVPHGARGERAGGRFAGSDRAMSSCPGNGPAGSVAAMLTCSPID